MNTALAQDRRGKTDDGWRTTDDRSEKMADRAGGKQNDVAAETEPPCSAVETELSDDAIIECIRNGDVNAFELLMRRYKHWVFGIVSKHVAHNQVSETVEDVFVQAYRSLPRYLINTSFKQWLALIASRRCCHCHSAANRHLTCAISNLNTEDREQMEAVCEEAACAAFHAETDSSAKCEAVRADMDRLEANDRRILHLLYFEDYSLQETAVMLGCTLGNARVRACRARKALRVLLKPAAVAEKPPALASPAAPSSTVDRDLSSAET